LLYINLMSQCFVLSFFLFSCDASRLKERENKKKMENCTIGFWG